MEEEKSEINFENKSYDSSEELMPMALPIKFDENHNDELSLNAHSYLLQGKQKLNKIFLIKKDLS